MVLVDKLNLWLPLSVFQIEDIKKGIVVIEHYHLKEIGIPTLLVSVSSSAFELHKEDFLIYITKGISVTNVVLKPEEIKYIEDGNCVSVSYEKWDIHTLTHETYNKLEEQKKCGL
jgi:hypothetical protein